MASGDEGHITVNNGRKLIEILADIPTYFKVNLKEKRPVGKFTFTYICFHILIKNECNHYKTK